MDRVRRYGFVATCMLLIILGGAMIVSLEDARAQGAPESTVQGWLTSTWGNTGPQDPESLAPTWYVTDAAGQRTEVVLPQDMPLGAALALDRQHVAVTGTPQRGQSSVATRLSASAIQASVPDGARAPEPAAGVYGSQRWISILCKFSDVPAEPRALSYFQGMFSSAYPGLDGYWREQSYNQINLAGSDAVGWFTLPHERAYYVSGTPLRLNHERAANDCTAVADSQVNFASYMGINLMFNTDLDGAAWGGGWYLTRDGVSRVWSMTWEPPWGYGNLTVMAHEMGHGFGLPHAAGRNDQGIRTEYNDVWDVMGDGWAFCSASTHPTYGCLGQHTIGYHKDRLGWFTTGRKYSPVWGSRTRLILERSSLPQTGAPQLIQVPINNSLSHFYTIEARDVVGYDVKLPGKAVILHEVDTSLGTPGEVLDSDHNGNTGDAGAMWTPGETFIDPVNDVTVCVNGATTSGFDVTVGRGAGSACTTVPPCAIPTGEFCAEYYPNPTLSGSPIVSTTTPAIAYTWGTGSPAAGMPADNFSVRWQGRWSFAAGQYRFTTTTDDGMRVWVDGVLIIDTWTRLPVTDYSVLHTLSAGDHTIKVEYVEKTVTAQASLTWKVATTACSMPSGRFCGEYYNNTTLAGSPVLTRDEAAITYAWGNGSPANGIYADNFSVRWIGRWAFNAGTYKFIVTADDGIRLWVDGVLIIDTWTQLPVVDYTVFYSVTAGNHDIKVEYLEKTVTAQANVRWEYVVTACTTTNAQFCAEYFNNTTLSGTPVWTRNETTINYDWGTGPPASGVNADNFTIRWLGRWDFTANTYRFIVRADDGIRIWVDGTMILDSWTALPIREDASIFYDLTAGWHTIQVEYLEKTVDANVKVLWEVAPRACAVPDGQFCAEYYNNLTLTGTPALIRMEAGINYNWGTASPASQVTADNFTVRWRGRWTFAGGSYKFLVTADDGMRIWVDTALILDTWTQRPVVDYSVFATVGAGSHEIRVEYLEKTVDARAMVRWDQVGGSCTVRTEQFCAEYYNNTTLSGSPVLTRDEPSISAAWGNGSPVSGVNADNFTVRWYGDWTFTAGTYRFLVTADDGIRVWVDGNRIIDTWTQLPVENYGVTQDMTAGIHTIKVEYLEKTVRAQAFVSWEEATSVCPTPLGAFCAEFYSNPILGGVPAFTQNVSAINAAWGTGGPGNGVPADYFTARWRGRWVFAGGTYAFTVTADDGIRLWVDGVLIVNSWDNLPLTKYSVTFAVAAGEHEINVEYLEKTVYAHISLTWAATTTMCAAPVEGFCAEYYPNTTLTGSPAVMQDEPAIDHDWGTGSPVGGVSADNFTVRWRGFWYLAAGTYTFIMTADDGMRIWIDGVPIADTWVVGPVANRRVKYTVTAGLHAVRVEYVEKMILAQASVRWEQQQVFCTVEPQGSCNGDPKVYLPMVTR